MPRTIIERNVYAVILPPNNAAVIGGSNGGSGKESTAVCVIVVLVYFAPSRECASTFTGAVTARREC